MSSKIVFVDFYKQKKCINLIKDWYINDTGGRGRTGTPSTGTGFWVQRVCQFRHAGKIITRWNINLIRIITFSGKAVTGFEPVMKVLQTSALPLGYTAIILLLQSTIKWRLYWGSWIRTNAWRSQSPLPYRLAIPQKWKGEWWESNPRMPEPQSGALTTSPHPP